MIQSCAGNVSKPQEPGNAIDSGTWLRHVRLGYNYRLDELSAAVGVAQLERIAELRAGRARVVSAYRAALERFEWLELPDSGPGEVVDWFVYVVRLAPWIDEPG